MQLPLSPLSSYCPALSRDVSTNSSYHHTLRRVHVNEQKPVIFCLCGQNRGRSIMATMISRITLRSRQTSDLIWDRYRTQKAGSSSFCNTGGGQGLSFRRRTPTSFCSSVEPQSHFSNASVQCPWTGLGVGRCANECLVALL